MDMEDQEKRIHDKFNANDSDVTIESADGVLFLLHTQNLKITTGAFPGSEFFTEGEHTKLTEDAEVLEVVFAYIYPQRHPNLESMEFTLLAKVAEAVEKYEVFPAINLCAMRMREFLPQHADDILIYAVKHDYPKIINEAALALSRSPLASTFIFKFSPTMVLAWTRYSESWDRIFTSAIDDIASMSVLNKADSTSEDCNSADPNGERYVSHKCLMMLLKWVRELEKTASLDHLKFSVGPLGRRELPAPKRCSNVKTKTFTTNTECIYKSAIAGVIQDSIAKMPLFEQYLHEASLKPDV